MGKMQEGKYGRQALVNVKKAVGKNGAEYGKGWLEIGGKLYKVQVTANNKDNGYAWVKVSECRRGGGGGVGSRYDQRGGY